MNFGQIQDIIRMDMPTATERKISPTNLKLIINYITTNICSITGCLYKEKYFDITAEQQTYLLSTIAPDFLVIRKEGVWWNAGDGTDTDWNPLDPETLESMNTKFENWRDDNSGDPERYFLFENGLKLHNKPDTTLTNGGLMHYGRQNITMTDNSDYPFHIDNDVRTQITHLQPLTECIFSGVDWRIAKAVGKDYNVVKAMYNDYISHIKSRMSLVDRRADVMAHKNGRMRGRKLC